jgi:shikimate dehydrogenase
MSARHEPEADIRPRPGEKAGRSGLVEREGGVADAATAPKRETTILVGLLGKGIQLSRTPAMHEAEGRALGIPYVYRLLDTDRMAAPTLDLAQVLRLAEDFGFSGLNVTFPYKQAVLPLLDDLSPAARSIGSVNTIVFRDGRRHGHNTDMWGFAESFRRGLPDAERRHVLLIGAGGAGAAVAHALLECGVERLSIADSEPLRAETLAERLSRHFGSGRCAAGEAATLAGVVDGIVNATPVGMAKVPGTPLDPGLFGAGAWVADIIYFPLETEFLRQARLKGCRTLAGDGMALFQAVRAFELFTGVRPDAPRMQAAFAASGRAPAGSPD